MFIATRPTRSKTKLRRSGMDLMRLNDLGRGMLDPHRTCRSYGAWLTFLTQGYKHGAPLGLSCATNWREAYGVRPACWRF